jgi:hypothetical protein
MRVIKHVDIIDEIFLIRKLEQQLLENEIHADNAIIITVSTDYSSIVGQYLRHALSYKKEICDGFGIDVPYPDETWNTEYVNDLHDTFKQHEKLFLGTNKKLLLVEAGVIRGSNYTYVVDYLNKSYMNDVITLALYENKNSVFKSNYVGEYYDNSTEDLSFWWERDNKHWDNS